MKTVKSNNITAAMEGWSDCPGDPCETSIPRMMVGTLEMTVKAGVRSTLNTEFRPPSCSVYVSEIAHKKQMNHCYKRQKEITFALIFRRQFVRYWSLGWRTGAMHWVTMPYSVRFFFFHGPEEEFQVFIEGTFCYMQQEHLKDWREI